MTSHAIDQFGDNDFNSVEEKCAVLYNWIVYTCYCKITLHILHVLCFIFYYHSSKQNLFLFFQCQTKLINKIINLFYEYPRSLANIELFYWPRSFVFFSNLENTVDVINDFIRGLLGFSSKSILSNNFYVITQRLDKNPFKMVLCGQLTKEFVSQNTKILCTENLLLIDIDPKKKKKIIMSKV